MGDRDYKAFIVEGEFREPQVIDNISKRFFNHVNCKLIPLPAGENIYMLWKKLEADDFETDIIEVLRESNIPVGFDWNLDGRLCLDGNFQMIRVYSNGRVLKEVSFHNELPTVIDEIAREKLCFLNIYIEQEMLG